MRHIAPTGKEPSSASIRRQRSLQKGLKGLLTSYSCSFLHVGHFTIILFFVLNQNCTATPCSPER